MPVPQSGTATTVVSTGTYDVARFGIEEQSVRAAPCLVKPPTGTGAVNSLAVIRVTHYAAGFMPTAFANAEHVRTPIISFAKFAARLRS